jgi:hypothetical protein
MHCNQNFKYLWLYLDGLMDEFTAEGNAQSV